MKNNKISPIECLIADLDTKLKAAKPEHKEKLEKIKATFIKRKIA